MRFQDKIVVVTGAGSQVGIGRQAALAFAREGAKLGICDRVPEDLEKTVTELRKMGADVLGAVTDVASTNEVNKFVGDVEDRFGAIDAVISIAGIARTKPFMDLTDEDIEETMGVNFGGTVRLIRAATPGMVDNGGGNVISISSVAARPWGWKNHAPYSASKAALEGLTRALAVEFGPAGIRVNAIAPGIIRTAMSADPVNSIGEEGLAKIHEIIPLRRVGRPEEIAQVALMLCSDESSYVTGQTVVVDGGITLGDLG